MIEQIMTNINSIAVFIPAIVGIPAGVTWNMVESFIDKKKLAKEELANSQNNLVPENFCETSDGLHSQDVDVASDKHYNNENV